MSLGESERLPSGYQEVEYIRKVFNGGSNNAYFDSGIKASYDLITEFVGKSTAIDSTDTGSVSFFGSRVGFTNQAYQSFPFYYSGGSSPYQYFNSRFGNVAYNYGSYVFPFTPDVKFTLKFGNGEIYKDGTKVLDMSNSSIFTSNLNVYIFACNNNGSVAFSDGYGTLDIYEMKMSRGGVLLRHFIPCYRKSDSEVGLYDLVSGTFFTNQGSGEFLAGVSILSKKQQKLYQQVEYIQNTTDNETVGQYILTGLNGYDFGEVKASACIASGSSANFFGGENAYPNYGRTGMGINVTTIAYRAGGYKSITNSLFGDNKSHSIEIGLVSSNRYLILDGVAQDLSGLTYYPSDENPDNRYNYNMPIFCRMNNQTPTTQSTLLRVDYFRVLSYSGITTRDFVPVYRKSDNEIGMLDVVNNVFYINEGSGAFTKGNNV